VTSAFALSLLLAGAARETPTPAQPPPTIKWEKNLDEALRKARRAGKPVIVNFWADWCGWCHRLDKTTYADPWVARKAQEFVAATVDTEGSRKQRDIAVKYQVASLPTIVFLSPTGRQLGRVNGFQGPGQFPRTLEAVLQIARRVMGWEETLERAPDDPHALFALGAHLFEQEYFDEARELLKQAVARDAGQEPDNRRQARMILAIIEHGYTRNFAEAERLVKEALALQPDDEDQPKLLFFLGRTYVSSGRQAEGVATFEVIVRQYPQSPIAQKARETLVNLGRRAAPMP
jgi:thiol-disulfide isomerase/thioredoxin